MLMKSKWVSMSPEARNQQHADNYYYHQLLMELESRQHADSARYEKLKSLEKDEERREAMNDIKYHEGRRDPGQLQFLIWEQQDKHVLNTCMDCRLNNDHLFAPSEWNTNLNEPDAQSLFIADSLWCTQRKIGIMAEMATQKVKTSQELYEECTNIVKEAYWQNEWRDKVLGGNNE